MNKRSFIGIDWGTSTMRAMLCDREEPKSHNHDVIIGDGISQLDRPISEAMFEAIAPLISRHGKIDIVLAGMAGSNIGWCTTPYLECPADLCLLTGKTQVFEQDGHQITILPGVSGRNDMGEFDVMRGEELQILGWMAHKDVFSQSPHLLCLPGTHTKWASVADGQLQSFRTAMSGEVFALLQKHSILVPINDRSSPLKFDEESFLTGVDLIARHPNSLLSLLFSVRARGLAQSSVTGHSPSFLSGLVIGSDVGSSLRRGADDVGFVEIIGAPELAEKYALAMAHFGVNCAVHDGIEAAYAGFLALNFES